MAADNKFKSGAALFAPNPDLTPIEKLQEEATAELLNLKTIDQRLEDLLKTYEDWVLSDMASGYVDSVTEDKWEKERLLLKLAIKKEVLTNIQEAVAECDFNRAERWLNASPSKVSIEKRIALHKKHLKQLSLPYFRDGRAKPSDVDELSYDFLDGIGIETDKMARMVESSRKARQESEKLNDQAKQAYREARKQENLGDFDGARDSYLKAEQKLQKGIETLGHEICVDNQNTLESNLAKVWDRISLLDSKKKSETKSADSQKLPGSRFQQGVTSTGSLPANGQTGPTINADEEHLYNQWKRETDNGTRMEQAGSDWWPDDKPVPPDCDTLKARYNDSLNRAYKGRTSGSETDFSDAHAILEQAGDCDWYARGVENLAQNKAASRFDEDRCERTAAVYRMAMRTADPVLEFQAMEQGAGCDWQSTVEPESSDYFQQEPKALQQPVITPQEYGQVDEQVTSELTCSQLNAMLLEACQQNRMGSVQHLQSRWNELGCTMSAALDACADQWIDSQMGSMSFPMGNF